MQAVIDTYSYPIKSVPRPFCISGSHLEYKPLKYDNDFKWLEVLRLSYYTNEGVCWYDSRDKMPTDKWELEMNSNYCDYGYVTATDHKPSTINDCKSSIIAPAL